MARPLNKLELGIIAQLARGATYSDLRGELDAKPAAISNAIQALRWRGLIEWGRLALPGQPEPEPEASPPPEPEPEPTPAAKPERRAAARIPEVRLPRPAPRTEVPAIGAVEPLPAEFRRDKLIAAKRRQTAYANRLAGKGRAGEVTRREAEKAAADAARLADPLEQAKSRLRRRGFTVFAAEVTGGPKGKFYVGGRLLTAAELLAKAST